MPVEPIETPSIPWTAGAYSGVVRAGDFLVLAGQIGVDPHSGNVVTDTIEAQVRQAFTNATAILTDCGAKWSDVARVTQYVGLDSAQRMKEINAIYEEFVGEHRPARSTVGVAWLPLGTIFEVELLVYKPA